jgi:hypothetical protein
MAATARWSALLANISAVSPCYNEREKRVRGGTAESKRKGREKVKMRKQPGEEGNAGGGQGHINDVTFLTLLLFLLVILVFFELTVSPVVLASTSTQ